MSARVVALHNRAQKHGTPAAIPTAAARVGGGIEGDVHAHRTTRAVLVVSGLAPRTLETAPYRVTLRPAS